MMHINILNLEAYSWLPISHISTSEPHQLISTGIWEFVVCREHEHFEIIFHSNSDQYFIYSPLPHLFPPLA